jgi:hypothetical protein
MSVKPPSFERGVIRERVGVMSVPSARVVLDVACAPMHDDARVRTALPS